MKYYEVIFTIQASEEMMQDARDILSALAGEAGFETFEDIPEGVKGYVQQSNYDEFILKSLLEGFPLPSSRISFTVSEAEDKDWNEQWEQEGFEPIVVNDYIMIHDGRHLADKKFPISIEIDAHLAFGTGTHETTRMMVGQLIDSNLQGKRLLDCGTGTGILAITALKLGACEAVGYDIDEWSVDNARHNAVINQVDNCFMSLLGDSSVLNSLEGEFDIVVANINRNILLNDMATFVSKMAPHSTLLLSGFYEQDIPLLEEKAAALGLNKTAQKHDGDWACLMFVR